MSDVTELPIAIPAAEMPPRLSTARAAVVADRYELLGDPHDGFTGSRLELKNPVETGSG